MCACVYPRCRRVSVNYFRPGGHRILFRSCTPSVYFGSGTSVTPLLRHRRCCCCSPHRGTRRWWYPKRIELKLARVSPFSSPIMVRWMTSFQGDASIGIRRTGDEINGEWECYKLFVTGRMQEIWTYVYMYVSVAKFFRILFRFWIFCFASCCVRWLMTIIRVFHARKSEGSCRREYFKRRS